MRPDMNFMPEIVELDFMNYTFNPFLHNGIHRTAPRSFKDGDYFFPIMYKAVLYMVVDFGICIVEQTNQCINFCLIKFLHSSSFNTFPQQKDTLPRVYLSTKIC